MNEHDEHAAYVAVLLMTISEKEAKFCDACREHLKQIAYAFIDGRRDADQKLSMIKERAKDLVESGTFANAREHVRQCSTVPVP